jgi:hypothetical protein
MGARHPAADPPKEPNPPEPPYTGPAPGPKDTPPEAAIPAPGPPPGPKDPEPATPEPTITADAAATWARNDAPQAPSTGRLRGEAAPDGATESIVAFAAGLDAPQAPGPDAATSATP